ncbi:MAG: hypothetical protein A2498_00010 [Lentisphaerae bacterium RIFOXYC12_FULL_60_16]|nr:MAG: hypothetical protein A2498_00010 [Lentisphaerae bacterium RIFOXYC12_FULL_60_16]OGV84346.1 MAG: hypothetical protein A2340_07980 [Lentisphaerae bacterium RIFOXYB12_FULL_60_10]
MFKQRWVWSAVGLCLMMLACGCNKERGRAKVIAKAFFRDLIDDDYTSATQFVDDNDVTALYENWPDMRARVAGADDWSVDVELSKSKTRGKAVCTIEGDGKDKKDISVAVDMKLAGGEWFVYLKPNPDARKLVKETPKEAAKDDFAPASGDKSDEPAPVQPTPAKPVAPAKPAESDEPAPVKAMPAKPVAPAKPAESDEPAPVEAMVPESKAAE